VCTVFMKLKVFAVWFHAIQGIVFTVQVNTDFGYLVVGVGTFESGVANSLLILQMVHVERYGNKNN